MPSFNPYTLQALTLLDAVNIVLANIGRGAVMSLESINLNSDAEDALKQVHNWNMQVQQAGWWFNTDQALLLDPDAEGRIMLPQGTLKVDTVGESATLDLVQRGKLLYDKTNHTTVIGKSVYVDLTVAIDFEELPQAVRFYVALKAARQFAQFKMADGATNQFTRDNESEAYLAVLEASDEADDRTLKDTNGHLARRRNRFHQG